MLLRYIPKTPPFDIYYNSTMSTVCGWEADLKTAASRQLSRKTQGLL